MPRSTGPMQCITSGAQLYLLHEGRVLSGLRNLLNNLFRSHIEPRLFCRSNCCRTGEINIPGVPCRRAQFSWIDGQGASWVHWLGRIVVEGLLHTGKPWPVLQDLGRLAGNAPWHNLTASKTCRRFVRHVDSKYPAFLRLCISRVQQLHGLPSWLL